MDINTYIGILYNRYCIYYNTSKDVIILDKTVDIFARYKDIQGRTFLTSKDIIDIFETNEICFVKHFEKIDTLSLLNFTEFLKKAAAKYVEPKRGHMCTYITGVIVTQDNIDDELKSIIKKFKYSKSYFFTLHGWCEIRLLVINPTKDEVISNKPGIKVMKFYTFDLPSDILNS